MNKDFAAQMLENIEKQFPGLTPERASQHLLAESLKTCSTIMDMTHLPVNPKVLDQLLNLGLLDQKEWSRLMNILDPMTGRKQST